MLPFCIINFIANLQLLSLACGDLVFDNSDFVVKTFATLSPIPGFMRWLLSKLAYQCKLAEAESLDMSSSYKESADSAFRENLLTAEEERAILDAVG